MLRSDGPGYGKQEDWQEFTQKPSLAYVDFANRKALWADNFSPFDDKQVKSVMKSLQITKESSMWGRESL